MARVGRGVAAIVVLVAVSGIAIYSTEAGALAMIDGPWHVPWVLVESTEYASGYSHRRFRSIHAGMTEAEVTAILGPPLRQSWVFSNPVAELAGERYLTFETDGTVVPSMPGTRRWAGKSMAVVATSLPRPDEVGWTYSEINDRDPFVYRTRLVWFHEGRVTKTTAEIVLD